MRKKKNTLSQVYHIVDFFFFKNSSVAGRILLAKASVQETIGGFCQDFPEKPLHLLS